MLQLRNHPLKIVPGQHKSTGSVNPHKLAQLSRCSPLPYCSSLCCCLQVSAQTLI